MRLMNLSAAINTPSISAVAICFFFLSENLWTCQVGVPVFRQEHGAKSCR